MKYQRNSNFAKRWMDQINHLNLEQEIGLK